VIPTEAHKNDLEKFYYTVNINYYALTHTDLIISFALSYYVYFILYLLSGSLAILMMIIFNQFLHRTIPSKKRAKMRYLIYLRLVWLPCLNGILILGVPLLIFVFILSILLRGFIFNIEIYSLSKGCTTDQNCIITYFDKFFYLP